MAQRKAVWVIVVTEIYPNGDISVTTSTAHKDLEKASEAYDRMIWRYIKEYGYAVSDEINTYAKSTAVLRNNSELKQAIITCTKTYLQ